MDLEGLKRQAAAKALEDVRDGMRLGLGTGSTARHFVDLLGERVRAGLNVVCVPTSEATRVQAEGCAIALTTLDETPQLDLTIDGADEVDPGLNLIKGAGGALLREKIVAAASHRMTVIADATKWVDALGRFPLPIEVTPFGLGATRAAIVQALEAAGCPAEPVLRPGRDGLAFVTDGGHWIVEAKCQRIPDAGRLAIALNGIPGVVEHGLFIGLASKVILADPAGVRVIERPGGR
jgi:ribose 5-phosphate isomerase A